MRFSIVVPFYNEEGNIEPLYRRLTAVMESRGEEYELVFVDDGSTDETQVILKKFRSSIHGSSASGCAATSARQRRSQPVLIAPLVTSLLRWMATSSISRKIFRVSSRR